MWLASATLADVWRFALARGWSPPPHEYGLLVRETGRGAVWAAGEGDAAPLAIGGALDSGDGGAHYVWLFVRDGAGERLLPLARAMRALLVELALGRPAGLVCTVRDDNMAGRRLAQLLGFAETAVTDGQRRQWRLRHERRRRHDLGQVGEDGAARAGATGG